ncbi:hypothetical protein [Niameybacter massiliensis]|uniref:hypothetical protein n=1 Tax=Niameybacter massiliensis TaxID=1658108 RepID=UPI001FA6FE9A|nr:hypothetical protein [Niameybacter massiliensis]
MNHKYNAAIVQESYALRRQHYGPKGKYSHNPLIIYVAKLMPNRQSQTFKYYGTFHVNL